MSGFLCTIAPALAASYLGAVALLLYTWRRIGRLARRAEENKKRAEENAKKADELEQQVKAAVREIRGHLR